MRLFDGLGVNMGNVSRLSDAVSRSISPENFTGEKGKGGMATTGTSVAFSRELGVGWKVSPSIAIMAKETAVLADIMDSGAIQQIWMTPSGKWRYSILRIYWDDQDYPSVECPVGDFFCSGWNEFAPMSSLAVCVNPGSAFNCYWEMPFRRRCRITMENIADEDMTLFYQINYTLTDVPDDCAYFHAGFRRVNPLPYKEVFTIVDGIQGKGQYVGTYMAWGSNNNGWWGEGEIKFFLDGDTEFPTICGTGTEDYFCGSYNFENKKTKSYQYFSTPYAGLHQIIKPDGLYQSQMRFGMYRFHITDPIRFNEDLKVTIQGLGWHGNNGYLPLRDDISAVAFWYQTLPGQALQPLPDKKFLEVI